VVARNISKRDSQKEEKAYKIKWLYQCFGISKQAYYQRIKSNTKKEMQAIKIKELIAEHRKDQTQLGIKKLYLDIQEDLKKNEIKLGRDGLFSFARTNDLLIPKTKLYHITTDSKHGYYKSPNLIKDILPTKAEQALVTDITYIKIQEDHAYLALVTDLYSKKIMGYSLADNMKVPMVKEALKMAIKNCIHKRETIIHHSDRGIQYCCDTYANFAKSQGFIMSTTEKYDPYENAVAERINGILKYEFGMNKNIPSIEIAKKMITQSVTIYNTKRRHYSLKMQTPNFAHTQQQHDYISYKTGSDKRIKC
jgi:transposase InsO family protein